MYHQHNFSAQLIHMTKEIVERFNKGMAHDLLAPMLHHGNLASIAVI